MRTKSATLRAGKSGCTKTMKGERASKATGVKFSNTPQGTRWVMEVVAKEEEETMSV